MAVSNQSINVRPAKPADCDLAVSLILLAAESMLVAIFGDGTEDKTRQFLHTAWHVKHSQFGYGQHTVFVKDDEPVGLCTFWHNAMPDVFVKDTARAMLSCYELEQAKQVLNRWQNTTKSLPKPGGDELIMGHIAVLPAYQRQGIGRIIIEYGEQQALLLEKERLSLDVDKDNAQAIAFYHAQGFVPLRKRPPEGTFIHMHKRLTR